MLNNIDSNCCQIIIAFQPQTTMITVPKFKMPVAVIFQIIEEHLELITSINKFYTFQTLIY